MATFTLYHGGAKPLHVSGTHVCRLVQFAQRNPGWHSAACDRSTRRALASAVRARCMEVIHYPAPAQPQFRFIYPT